jgi:hypothetical protein
VRPAKGLHAPLRGRDAVRAFAGKFRAAFPDLNFWGTTVLKVENGLITEEIGLDDGVTALSQLGLIPQA